MYALHGGYLDRSFRILPADTAVDVISHVQKSFPHRYESTTGESVYLSRLPDQVNPAYEQAYGYWIPRNARQALLSVFVLEQYADRLDELVTDCTN
ncbi:hypothetical protein MSZK_17170 [Mycobacterium sp. shizuoka-1]|nr:hypothetical protein MSZK_17170 [Mycobacterium sp. shizuoka-1]